MENQQTKPVEFYPIERMTIKIGEEKVIWRKLTLEITSKLGEHTIAKLRYLAPLSHERMYNAVIEKEEDTEVVILGRNNIHEYMTNSKGEQEQIDNSKIFLNGVIKDLEILKTKADAVLIEMTCISKSVLLDRIPRYRSFQDPTISYKDILEEVNKNYRTNNESEKSNFAELGDGLKEVPRMTIQYNETDWEYLKRIGSYVGEPVIVFNDKVLLGFLKDRAMQTPNISYSVYGLNKSRKRRSFKIRGSEIYTVSTPIKLKINGNNNEEATENEYYVLESRIYNEGNMLKSEYVLGKQSDYFVDPIPNEKIKGAVIEGRVKHIARTDESKSEHGRTEGSSSNLEDKSMGAKPVNLYVGETEEKQDKSEEIKAKDIAVMTLDLSEGLQKLGGKAQSEEDKYAGKSYFPYVTPYSQTNTGFTPAPEENDRVALYFPSENESHGIVIGAVNNDGNGRFTNPDKRNFTLGPSQVGTNEGKPKYNFTLDSEKFIVNVGSIISMTSSGTVDISGTSDVSLVSTGASTNLTASTDLTAEAQSGIATLKGNTHATVKGNENAEISGGSNTNVGLSSTGASNKTIVAGAGKVEVKGGEVEIN